MEYQVSARKYRPGTFDDVIGQPHVVQTLKNAIGKKRVAHAYVFSGMRGVGKTTVARILAKGLNCEQSPASEPCEKCQSCLEITRGHSVDVIEIDGASNTGVDDVRELRENVKFSPFRGGYRVYIIDEVHMLSNSAFNALLKTLEEPPDHAVFVLATTEVHKIPATILSRCQHFTFRRIPRLEVIAQLRHVAQETGVAIEDRSLVAIARASDGSMRDALSLLDQAVAFGGTQIIHENLEALIGTVPDELVRSLVQAIVNHDAPSAVGIVGQAFDQGYDVRIFCREVVEQMRNLLVAAVVSSRDQVQVLLELQQEEVETVVAQAQQVGDVSIQEWFQIFSRTEDILRASLHPRFVFEAAVIKATQFRGGIQKKVEVSEPSHIKADSPPKPSSRSSASQDIRPPQSSSVRPDESAAKKRPASPRISTEPQKVIPNDRNAKEGRSKQKGAETKVLEAENLPVSIEKEKLGDLNWELVIDRVIQDHPNIGSFLEMGTLVSIEPDRVVIGYPKSASVARWRTDKLENRTLVAKVCAQVAGRPMNVRVIELSEAQAAKPNIAQQRAKRKQEEDQGLLEEVRAHPLVKQAQELFGGEVVSARRVPPKEEAS